MLQISTSSFILADGSEAMEPIVNEVAVKTIIKKSNLPVCDYSVNPYVGCPHACKYCYASFMKRFTWHIEPWGTFLDVKCWEPIKNPGKYRGKEFFVGSVTDPYNSQEAEYKRTRAFLEQMQGSGAKISIQTKSDLVLRDNVKSFRTAKQDHIFCCFRNQGILYCVFAKLGSKSRCELRSLLPNIMNKPAPHLLIEVRGCGFAP